MLTIEQAKEAIAERKHQAETQEGPSLEKAYGRGDDYVSQTTAAQKDHTQRQETLNEEFRNREVTERLQKLRERLVEKTDAEVRTDHSHDEGPDKQREAPGGGQTRSR